MGRNSQQRRAHKQRQQATRQRSAPVRTGTGGSSPTLDELIGFACEAAFGPGADKALFARTHVARRLRWIDAQATLYFFSSSTNVSLSRTLYSTTLPDFTATS